MLDGRVAICTGSGRGVGGEVAKLMAAHGAKIVVNDPGTSGTGEGTDTTPAQEIVDQIKAAGGDAVANYGYVNKFDDCLQMVQPGARHVRRAAHRVQRRRHPARQDVPQHVPGGLAGRHRRPSDRAFQPQPGRDQPVPRAELRPHDPGVLDLGAARQCRPGELRLGQVRHRRAGAHRRDGEPVARHHRQRHRAVGRYAHDPLGADPEGPGRRGGARGAAAAQPGRRDRAAYACFSPPSRPAMSTARYSTSAPANCRCTATCGRCAWCTARAAGPRRRSPRSRCRRWRTASPRSTRATPMPACRWSEPRWPTQTDERADRALMKSTARS